MSLLISLNLELPLIFRINDLATFLDTERCVVSFEDFNRLCYVNEWAIPFSAQNSSAEAPLSLVSYHNLIDVEACRDTKVQFAHFQGTSHARLDRMYVSNFFKDQVTGHNVFTISYTDHCLVPLRSGSPKFRSSHHYWRSLKLNVSLLGDGTFDDNVVECCGLYLQVLRFVHFYAIEHY